MKSYQKLFLYDEIILQIEKILKKSKEIKNDKNRIEKIYENLALDFLIKIKEIGKKGKEDDVKECKNLAEIISVISKETFFELNKAEALLNYKIN